MMWVIDIEKMYYIRNSKQKFIPSNKNQIQPKLNELTLNNSCLIYQWVNLMDQLLTQNR